MRRQNEARAARLAACMCLLAGILLLVAGSRDGRSPTEPCPGPGPTVPPAPSWSGSWTFDEAAPAGDCLADAMNDWRSGGGMLGWHLLLDLEADNGSIRIRFHYPGFIDDDEGFSPLEYAGTVDADGGVRASAAPSSIGTTRTDPWGELCYWEWTTLGGELSGTLSPDGRALTGAVVDTFRAEPSGKTFTIRSHFEARR